MTVPFPDAAPHENFGSEHRQVALAFVPEAFAETIPAGIEGEIFAHAHAAVFAVLQELVATYGGEPVAAFAERLPASVRSGEFSVANRL
jgi:hypothetical protein